MSVITHLAAAAARHCSAQAAPSANTLRRVSLLIDSMHSAAIDVGKILSDEIDDRAWDSYRSG